MKEYLTKQFYITCAILVMVIIFIGSSFTGSQVEDVKNVIPFSSNIAHFIEYAVLRFFWAMGLKDKPKGVIYVFTICLLYAISDEYHQTFVSGRVQDYMDIIINMFGVTTSATIIKLIKR